MRSFFIPLNIPVPFAFTLPFQINSKHVSCLFIASALLIQQVTLSREGSLRNGERGRTMKNIKDSI